eukprot:TRINITY_DN910_c1_g3_i1.p1 TRINITY_DN910_c1_g3~~TRINITY_DN910_c1_g3_i1.p1  ORF type:complete len:703 (+),score=112.43 TRINITY_DN910_c1_g3_i1:105-2213(+)
MSAKCGSPTGRIDKSVHSLAFHSCLSESGPIDDDDDDDEDEVERNTLIASANAALWARNQNHSMHSNGLTDTVMGASTVIFKNITIRKPGTNPESNDNLLTNVSGVLQPGKLTAILGSNDLEVSALLNIVAGAVSDQEYTGHLAFARRQIGSWYRRSIVGFALQRGVYCSKLLTVRQNLMFVLQLHIQISSAEQDQTVDRVLEMVHLKPDERKKIIELSAESKLRMTIAQELLLDPSVIVVEAPTSGLGYQSSLRIMRLLKGLAENKGKTVVVSLSQPRWAVYNLLDNLILLHGSHLAYFGKAGEHAIEYFQSQGMVWNRHYTPTDFLLQLCDSDEVGWSTAGEEPRMSAAALDLAYSQSPEYQSLLAPYLIDIDTICSNRHTIHTDVDIYHSYQVPSELSRILILLKSIVLRHWVYKWWHVLRWISTVGILLLIGKLYSMQSTNQAGLQNKVGIIFFVIVLLMLMNIPTAASLIRHRPVFLHHRGSGSYTTPTYWTVTILWELIFIRMIIPPIVAVLLTAGMYWFITFEQDQLTDLLVMILIAQSSFYALSFCVGCYWNSTSSANTVLQAIFAFFIMTGGFLINTKYMPSWFSWIEKFSFFRYTYESILINMLSDTDEDSKTYISDQGFHEDNKWKNMYILLGIAIGLLLAGLVGLFSLRPPLVVTKSPSVWQVLTRAVRNIIGYLREKKSNNVDRYQQIP